MALARFRLEAVQAPADVAEVEQAVGDGHCGKGSIQTLIGPNTPCPGDVTRLRRVNAVQRASAPAVLRVAAKGHVDTVVVEDGRADDFAFTDERAVVLVQCALAPFIPEAVVR